MKYLKVFTNWRIIALTVIAAAALLLILGDGNRLNVIIFSKIVGFFLAYFAYRIGRHWHDSGEIDELNVFSDNGSNE